MHIVSISGHRPEKIDDPTWVKKEIKDVLPTFLLADHLIQGMAAGVDLWSAVIARQLGIMYTCAKPWAGHKPRKDDEQMYREVEKFADRIEIINPSEEFPGNWCYQRRNEWMVDNSDQLLAVWDGSKGGTANCVNYALKKGIPIFRIDPKEKKRGWYANSPV